MQTSAEISAQAIHSLAHFLIKATGTNPTQTDMRNAMYLVMNECEKCRKGFELSEWHKTQPVHAFEALSCKWQGQNHRYSPLTLNLHFLPRPDGSVYIGSPEELPLGDDYFTQRVIEDSKYSPTGD